LAQAAGKVRAWRPARLPRQCRAAPPGRQAGEGRLATRSRSV